MRKHFQLEATIVPEQQTLDGSVAAAAKLTEIHSDAKEKIEKAQETHKRYFDRKRTAPDYIIGNKVYVNNPKRINRKGDKLAQR